MHYPFVKQITNWDCSLACLAMIIKYYTKKSFNYHHFIETNAYYQKLNLWQLTVLAKNYHLALLTFKVNWNDFCLYTKKKPLICQLQTNQKYHFVIIYQKKRNKYLIGDPEQNELIWIDNEELAKKFCGIVVLAEPITEIKTLPNLKKYWYFDKFFLIGSALALLISILLTIGQILNQWFLKIFLDEWQLISFTKDWIPILIGISIVSLQSLILMTIQNYLTKYFGMKFYYHWYSIFINQLLTLKYHQFLKHQSGKWLLKYQYFQEIMTFYFPVILQILETSIMFLGIIGFLIFFYHQILFPILLMIFIKSLLNFFWSLKWIKFDQEELVFNSQIKQQWWTFFNHYVDLKNRNHHQIMNIKLTNHYWQQKTFANNKNNYEFARKISNYLFNTFLTIMSIYLLIFSHQKNTTIGQIVLLFYLIQLLLTKNEAIWNYWFFYKRIHKLKQIMNPLLFKEKILKNEAKNIPKNTFLISLKFEDLNHHFGDEKWLWKKSFSQKLTNNTLIYGKSGSGKSTLLNFLKTNLYPEKGNIWFNQEHNLKNLSTTWWNEQVYLLSSNSPLYHQDLIKNIFKCSNPCQTQWKIWNEYQLNDYLKTVNLSLKITTDPENLSQGQRQMLNGLQLFFCHEKLWLMDEALNSIPPITKQKLLKNLLKFATKNNKFIIYNSHDPELTKIFPNNIDLNENFNQ